MKVSSYFTAAALSTGLLFDQLFRYVFHRSGSKLLSPFLDSKGHEDDYYIQRDKAADRLRRQPCQRLYLLSPSGHMLHGFYYPFGAKARKIAFIIHGYRSEHAETAGMFFEYYKSRGFDVFCCDHAAAGESEGGLISFDVNESRDCLAWLRLLRQRFGEDTQIILHGFSMGGASVLQMSGKCPDNVKFIVSDSAYMDARELLRQRTGPMYRPLSLMYQLRLGFGLEATDVRESLMSATVPILFVHGEQDGFVPFENAPKLYRLYPGEKDSLFVPNARHIESMYVAPEEYRKKLDEFIQRFIR